MNDLKTVVYLGCPNEVSSCVFEYFTRRGAKIIYADLSEGLKSSWRDEGSILFIDVEGVGGQKQVYRFLKNSNFEKYPVPTILFYNDQLDRHGKRAKALTGLAPLSDFDDPYSVEFAIAQATTSYAACKKEGKILSLKQR
ncbi:hypothetical protein PXK30_22805 [Phaeobacter gallaeciensis]|nr:hypothetical protein [Phaeobacter gallaeciensis]MDE4201818.1 hypothetical protein [Phaeobacter gallaeciensis]MDE4218488.1 hypothetical protein [Phaeobacter gallaeciensis]MDE4235152.1 hypothetical protein [Phaeobacter gallaeciensis]MDE4247600.1 hypothetical protein [Phaeobacter gallaeciensis]MDE4251749.1 hypothetical protein [Phaeobacter gallaeciensis]